MSDGPPGERGAGGSAGSPAGLVGVGGKLRAVGVAVGLLIAGLLVSVTFGLVFTVPLVLFGQGLPASVTFLAFAAVGQFAFLVVGGAYVSRAGGVSVRWPTRRDLQYTAGGLLAALGLVFAISALVTAAGVAPGGSVFDDPIARDPTVALGLAALSIVLVAPAEELLFRGAIQGRLRRSFGPAGAVAGSSLIFGSIHLVNFIGSVTGAVVGAGIVTAGGAVLGTVYERTENLVVPIAVHGAYNAVLLVGAFLAAGS